MMENSSVDAATACRSDTRVGRTRNSTLCLVPDAVSQTIADAVGRTKHPTRISDSARKREPCKSGGIYQASEDVGMFVKTAVVSEGLGGPPLLALNSPRATVDILRLSVE